MRTGQSKKQGTLAGVILLVACALVGWMQGCGNETTQPVPVDPQQAAQASAQAAQFAQLATNESVLDAVEDPFTAAVGDLDGLGEVGLGNDDLGDLSGPTVVAQAIDGLRTVVPFGAGVRVLSAAVLDKAVAGHGLAAPECNPLPGTACQSANVCTESTSEPGVVTVTIEKAACEGVIASSEQRFVVDTKGTVLQDDDEIRSYWSLTELLTGTEIEVSMQPVTGPAIVDGARVDLTEIIRHPVGIVSSQTNSIEMDVGDVQTDGDEVIWDLSSVVAFRNGASASVTATEVAEGAPNGITDGDRVRVIWQWTAGPANPRLESASATVEVLVGVLADAEDDLYASVQYTVVFDGTTALGGLPTASALFVPVEPVAEGEEPCGGTLTQTASFPATWDAQSLQHTLVKSCDTGGSSDLEITFADGSSFSRTIAWTGTGSATLDVAARDGTTIHGTWNASGSTATFAVDTLFPAGNDPVSVHQEGSSDRSAGTRSYTLVVTFLDEHQESLAVQAQRNLDGTRTLTGAATNPAGTTTFALEWDPETQVLTGTSHGPVDESGSFTLQRLEDGGALLVFTWNDPSEDLTVEGVATIGPDGKGCGELSVSQGSGSSRYMFCFDADGRGFIGGGTSVPF
ncbi:MAG TPA: hypothetical protein VFD07_15070 [Candidatus Krumholzibacteria bacterium]|nr:hypothetical protein [Candidatus Krumholzibacteria bacterium]